MGWESHCGRCSKDTGPVRWSETWLKLAGCVREKHCSGWLMNSAPVRSSRLVWFFQTSRLLLLTKQCSSTSRYSVPLSQNQPVSAKFQTSEWGHGDKKGHHGIRHDRVSSICSRYLQVQYNYQQHTPLFVPLFILVTCNATKPSERS